MVTIKTLDNDAEYIKLRIEEADNTMADAAVHADRLRLEAGKRLIQVQSRLSQKGNVRDKAVSGTFVKWLADSGIARTTAFDLMKRAGYTEEQRTQAKAKEAARKRKQRAKQYRVGWINVLVAGLGVTHGSLRDDKAKLEKQLGERIPDYFHDQAAAAAFVERCRPLFIPAPKREEFTESQKAKVDRAIKAEHDALQKSFWQEVDKKVLVETAERLHKLEEMEKEARTQRDLFETLSEKIVTVMTEKEYRLILQCLHPDRAPEDRKTMFAQAFAIIRRWGDNVEKKFSKKDLKAHGW